MTRLQLIKNLGEHFPDISEEKMERIVSLILEEITTVLAKGHRAEFRNFGAFSMRHRSERFGHNPKTGETVKIEKKDIPFFKCSKILLNQLNQRN